MSERYLRGTFFVLLGILFAKLTGFLIRVFVTRLGPEEAGVYYLATYLLKAALLLAFLGFEGFIVRDVAEAQAQNNLARVSGIIRYSSSILIPSSLLFALGISVFAPYLASWYQAPLLRVALYLIALTLPFEVFLHMTSMVSRAVFDWKRYVLFANFGKEVFRLIGVGIAVYTLGTLTGILLGQLVGLAGLTGIAFFVLRAHLFTPTAIDWKQPLPFVVPLYGAVLAFASLEWTDSFFIGRMLSVADVGVYDTTFSLAWLLLLLPTASSAFFLPRLLHLKTEQLPYAYRRVIAWNLAGNGFLASVFILFGESIIRTLFGEVYASGYPLLVILALGFFLSHSHLPARSFLYIHKRGKLLFSLAFIALGVNCVLNYTLIQHFGLTGAAYATTTSTVLLTLGYVVSTYREFGILPVSRLSLISYTSLSLVVMGWIFGISSSLLVVAYPLLHLLSPAWRKEIAYVGRQIR